MTIETFWRIIEAAGKASHGDCRRQAQQVTDALGELDPEEVLAFDRILDGLLDEAYSWDLWGAADLINRGCSDDGFTDFRGWLIAQGRNIFRKALRDPDSLAEHAAVSSLGEFDTLWCQELLAAPLAAYEKLTGDSPPIDQRPPAILKGEKWDFDDEILARQRYPRLWALVRSQ